MFFNTKINLIIVMLVFSSMTIFSQSAERKNLVRINLPFFYFFDNSPFILNYFKFYDKSQFPPPKIEKEAFSLGFSYTYLVKKNLRIGASFSLFSGSYYSSITNKKKLGSISDRSIYLINLFNQFEILNGSKYFIAISSGLSFRKGYETMIVDYPNFFEVIVKDHLLRDIGISVGGIFNYSISKHFVLICESNLNYFILRKSKGGENPNFPNLLFDKGSTKFQLMGSIGLGYKF